MKISRWIPFEVKLYLFNKKLKKKFKTKIFSTNIFDINKIISIGNHCYGPIHVMAWGETEEGLKIGNFVSIASGVKFILGGNHALDCFLTYPFTIDYPEYIGTMHSDELTKGCIEIGDDVWIGSDVTILSGVKVGQGAVLAAGSVVVKDVPPYAVVAGNPCKVKKFRFDQAIIDYILKYIHLDDLDDEWINANMDLLNKRVDLELIKLIKERMYSQKDGKD